ncbi:MAG: TetR/AcrR family transcriptional regulator [Candidatus Marinimicrobia bacterium]|nr:TetR/AcrR family transcriptional regulator [Candidatus Neomarinimicrobiota bacterium]MCF7830258.1 TetR/AcrR family transcriptional regulator [Candidatus Neomarinimicrobiota bacterium]MCF7882285.1 TetR/AcrR family transcriptional regulator [Candidatus Neomarinimicrobiota bacterium]
MEPKQRLIIDTAIDIFAEKGFQQTTMQEIAETAGVGKGTIYRFYSSKDDLLSSLVEFAIEDVTNEIRQALEPIDDPVEKLRAIIAVEIAYYDDHPNLAKFLIREVLGYRMKFEDHIRQIQSSRTAILEPIIQNGLDSGEFRQVNPTTIAAAIEGMILASVIQWFLLDNGFPREEIQADLETSVFRGLLK